MAYEIARVILKNRFGNPAVLWETPPDHRTKAHTGVQPACYDPGNPPRNLEEVAMKKSLHTSGMADRILRICRLVLPATLALGATTVAAQAGGTPGQPLNSGQPQNSLAGQWRGVLKGITLTIVIQANGQYTQTTQSGTLMTEQSGTYVLVAPNTIIFGVTDWAPKTLPVYHPYPNGGGYYTEQPTTVPPGGTDSYVFKGANTLILTDQVMHGSVTMTRVQ
jgi:hypothetical protein